MNDVAESEQALTEARAALAVAEQDAEDAAALVATLEERVRDGDATVSADEIAARHSLVAFAKLRTDHARRVAEQKDADQRQAYWRAIGAEVRAVIDAADRRIADVFVTALTVFRELWTLGDDRHTVVLDLRRRAKHAIAEADEHGEREALRDAGLADVRGGAIVGRWPGNVERTVEPVTPAIVGAHVLSVLMAEVLEEQRLANNGKRGHIDPPELQQIIPLTAQAAREIHGLPTAEAR